MRFRLRRGPFTFGRTGTRLSLWRRRTGVSSPLSGNNRSFVKIGFGPFSWFFRAIVAGIRRGGKHKQPKLPCETVSRDLLKVRARHVIDGDTVIVSKFWSDIRIRLYAIDCPEDGQEWGNTAKAGLIKLIGRRYVYIEKHGVDKHGRTLATVYVQHGHGSEWINVNERMVMLGHAWVMPQYCDHLPESRQHQLNRLERWARSKQVGLWKLDNPIPPWIWRNQQDK